MSEFRLGDWNAACAECGRTRKASEMKRSWKGYYVCPEHWEPRHPQDFVKNVNPVQVPTWVQRPADTYIPTTQARSAVAVIWLGDNITLATEKPFAETVTLSELVNKAVEIPFSESVTLTESFTWTFAGPRVVNGSILNSTLLG